jgi:hypothetical protein
VIGKERIVFDVGSQPDSDNIGAFVRSSASGALVTNHSLTANTGISFAFVDADITPANDTITEAAHGLQTGDVVRLTTTGTLPSALALLTDYFVIRVSSSLIKLATTAMNAEAGTAIDIAADGSGTHTLTTQDTQRRALDVYISNPIEIDVGLDAADDSVESWTHDGTGNPISSTGGSLHVSDGGGSLTVDASNLDIRDLVFATDKVDVSGSSVSITGTVGVTQSTSPWVVSATDLDIRDITHVSDSIKVGDGTDFLVVNGDGSINITDNGGSLTVDAVNLDIRDLTAVSDSVSSWTKDGTGTAITSTLVGADQALDVYIANTAAITTNDAALANTALLNTQTNVTNVSAALLASQQANRKYLYVQNLGTKPMYVGPSGVTTSNGLRISVGAVGEFRFGAALSLHAVTPDAGPHDARILEAS